MLLLLYGTIMIHVENKRCSKCHKDKDLSCYRVKVDRKNPRYCSSCRECDNKWNRSSDGRRTRNNYESSPRGKANIAWASIEKRCLNKDGKHPTYKNIHNRLDREWFINWYVENCFDRCSVDRVRNKEHYEKRNLQMLTVSGNTSKGSK